jgi:hypothetical protein
MIGNRQVTLSVYRQLDEVPYDDVEPFGRVRDSKDEPGAIYIVGKHTTTGTLVRSSIDYDSWVRPAPDSFRHWIWHHDYMNGSRRRVSFVTAVGEMHASRRLLWQAYRSADCIASSLDQETSYEQWSAFQDAWDRGDSCDLDGLFAEWRAEADKIVTEELLPHELR